jgi:uncharacterized protein involved in outer membrane biogenesis
VIRRALLVTGGVVVGLVLLLAAAVAAILASAPGHAVARRLAVGALRKAVDGRVTIGSLGGSLWRAAELTDVTLAMPDGRPVIRVASVKVSFALADLVRHRYVLSRVELSRPTVVLETGADGHLNIEHLFRLLQPKTGPPGRRPLVELRGVRIVGGTMVLRDRRRQRVGVRGRGHRDRPEQSARLRGLRDRRQRWRAHLPAQCGRRAARSELARPLPRHDAGGRAGGGPC